MKEANGHEHTIKCSSNKWNSQGCSGFDFSWILILRASQSVGDASSIHQHAGVLCISVETLHFSLSMQVNSTPLTSLSRRGLGWFPTLQSALKHCQSGKLSRRRIYLEPPLQTRHPNTLQTFIASWFEFRVPQIWHNLDHKLIFQHWFVPSTFSAVLIRQEPNLPSSSNGWLAVWNPWRIFRHDCYEMVPKHRQNPSWANELLPGDPNNPGSAQNL